MAAPASSTIDLSINANVGKYTVTIPVTLATLTNAAQFQVTPGHKGRLLAMDFYTHTPGTGAGATCTLTPDIGGTNVTGGVVTPTLASTSDRNEKTAGTAITAANSFTATQTITVTGSATTAFTAGDGMLALTLINDDTREAVAEAKGGLRTGT